jgi:hypothetical protein
MKNLLEDAVREIHAALRQHHPQFCACARCSDDVVSLVMNHTRPRYATSPRGYALAGLEIWGDQTRAELAVLVFDAMRRVSLEPRHTPLAGTSVIE